MNEETNEVETKVVDKVSERKIKITPVVKRVLIWGGVAVGVIVGAILLNRTNELQDEVDHIASDQDDILDVLEENELIHYEPIED